MPPYPFLLVAIAVVRSGGGRGRKCRHYIKGAINPSDKSARLLNNARRKVYCGYEALLWPMWCHTTLQPMRTCATMVAPLVLDNIRQFIYIWYSSHDFELNKSSALSPASHSRRFFTRNRADRETRCLAVGPICQDELFPFSGPQQ